MRKGNAKNPLKLDEGVYFIPRKNFIFSYTSSMVYYFKKNAIIDLEIIHDIKIS